MSLINDMLRDLSERQAASPAYAGDDINFHNWEKEKASHFFGRFSHWPVILLSVVLFIFIVGIVRWVGPHSNPLSEGKGTGAMNPVSAQDVNKAPIELDNSVIYTSTVGMKESSVVELKDNSAVETEPEQPSLAQQQSIYELIDKASRALALDRLTSPVDDNAWFYYQSLLKLDSQNTIALDGLVRITQRYLQMIETAINQQQFEKATGYLKKAKLVSTDIELPAINAQALKYFDQQLTSSQPILQTGSVIESASDNTVVNESSNLPVEHMSENRENSEALENSVSVENPLAQVQSVVRMPNQEFVDEQSVEQAKKLITDGQLIQAVELLKSQIQQLSSPLSEIYLLDIYYQQQNKAAMESLLTRVSLSDVNYAYYHARLSILQGDNFSAIHQLESQLVSAKQNENFRALLAGLYQREGQSLQAVTAYRNLLQDFIPQPAYWLGMALSLDAEQQSQSAIFAYQKLLEFDSLDQNVSDYAQHRITELSQ